MTLPSLHPDHNRRFKRRRLCSIATKSTFSVTAISTSLAWCLVILLSSPDISQAFCPSRLLPLAPWTTTNLPQQQHASKQPLSCLFATRRSTNNKSNKTSNTKSKRGGGPTSKLGASKSTKPGNKGPKSNSNNNSNNSKGSSSASPSPSQAASAASPVKKSSTRTPPWQVLSPKDAKKNAVKEKARRERIQKGLQDPTKMDDFDDEEEDSQQQQLLSTTFLDDKDKRVLGWKRFNPSTVPSGLKYEASVLGTQSLPRLGVPEIAFLGRSNVGKSSLLNKLSSLTTSSASDVARVGKTPGATASVNLYALYDKKEKPILGMVDLPGFGYAKLSKTVQESVQLAAERYLGKRTELMLGILLVDVRREPSEDDRAVLAALYDMNVPIVVVATKMDKCTKNELEPLLEQIRMGLGLPMGQPLCVSSVTGEGVKPLWSIILEGCEVGVEDFKAKLLERGGDKQQNNNNDNDNVEEEYDEDAVYDQGYDWIHDGAVVYEGGDDDEDDYLDTYDDGDEDSWNLEDNQLQIDTNEQQQQQQKLESIKFLKRKAREMERGGQV